MSDGILKGVYHLYAAQEGYMDIQEGWLLFRGVIYCSGGLYAVQEGYSMVSVRVICRPANSAKCFWEPDIFRQKFLRSAGSYCVENALIILFITCNSESVFNKAFLQSKS